MLAKIAKLYLLLMFICQLSLHADDLGSLEPVEGSPFATGCSPRSIAFSPEISSNLFAAVTNQGNDTVSVYSVDVDSGAFTLVAPFSTGDKPVSVAFSPVVSGNLFAAVANKDDDTVSAYAVDADSGLFTLVSSFPTGDKPVSVAFSPVVSGNLFAAVANKDDDTVSVYTVDTDSGLFTLVSSFPTGHKPVSVAFSPGVSGKLFALVANKDKGADGHYTVTQYSVDTDSGEFTVVFNIPTRHTPISVACSPDLSGLFLYAAVATAGKKESFQPSGIATYQALKAFGIYIGPFGTQQFSHRTPPDAIAFSPEVSGNLFMAVPFGSLNDVSVYNVNTSTGRFTATGPRVSTGDNPRSVAFSPVVSGNLFVAVANFGDRSVSVYKVKTSA
jgi:6-phosphogluconolactonase (cycloisomerase 2 family)